MKSYIDHRKGGVSTTRFLKLHPAQTQLQYNISLKEANRLVHYS